MTTRFVDSGWWELILTNEVATKVRGELKFDMVVVGGGFTGLACARRLAELCSNDRIALIEADRIGRTLSGRNSGFLLESYISLRNPDIDSTIPNRLQKAGLDQLRRLVTEHGIECDWNETGYFHAAISDYERRVLDQIRAIYDKQTRAYEVLSGDEVNANMGTKASLTGLRTGRTTLVQPTKLVRGLAACLPENVSVFEMSRVQGVSTLAGRHNLSLPGGKVSCSSLFLCCNRGLPAMGYGRHSQVEVANFAAVTPVLDATHGAIATVPEFGILPSILTGPTIRKTPDNRLLMREYLVFTPGRAATQNEYKSMLKQARKSMVIRWPQLTEVPFEYAWHGVTPITRNGARFFGKVGSNIYAAAFCNGAGVTSGTSAGTALADLAEGQDGQSLNDLMKQPKPNFVPPAWILKHFVNRAMRKSDEEWPKAYGALLKQYEG